MRVLLLASSPDRRDAARRTLERAGVEVLLSSGTSAPDALLISPDIAFGDASSAPGLPVVLLLAPGDQLSAAVVRAGASDALLLDARGELVESEVARLVGLVARTRDAEQSMRLSAACEASAAGVLLVSADGRVERGNGAFARLSGRAVEAIPGASLSSLVVPEGDEADIARFFAALLGGAAFTGEARIERDGGPAVPCRVSVAPTGPTGGAVVTLLDLTHRVAAEASLRALNRRLEERSRLDALSGLYNRTYLHEALERELSRARRYTQPLAALMIDLDDFKVVNDVWGHDAGDEVLRAVAVALRAGFREGDIVARYGGDEFCAVLPSTDDAAAAQVAERVRDHVKALRLGPSGAVGVRASLGIATLADVGAEAGSTELLRLADRAMLAAKWLGGDRVTAHRGVAAAAAMPPPNPSGPRVRLPFGGSDGPTPPAIHLQ